MEQSSEIDDLRWRREQPHRKNRNENKKWMAQVTELRAALVKKLCGKPFKNLPTKDKDFLLEAIGKILGLLPSD